MEFTNLRFLRPASCGVDDRLRLVNVTIIHNL